MPNFPCFKCNGSGQVNAFSHIANGVCFQCGGTGKLSAAKKVEGFTPVAPIVPEATRSTTKQWDFIAKLAGDNDATIRAALRAAGSTTPAMQLYVTKATMSRAIDIAKGMPL